MTLIVSSHRIDPLGVGSIRKEHVPGNRRHVRKEHTEPQRNHEEVQEVYRCVERGESSSWYERADMRVMSKLMRT